MEVLVQYKKKNPRPSVDTSIQEAVVTVFSNSVDLVI
jgi:hypothetical protein